MSVHRYGQSHSMSKISFVMPPLYSGQKATSM